MLARAGVRLVSAPCAACGRTGKAQEALAEALDIIGQLKARIEELAMTPEQYAKEQADTARTIEHEGTD